LRKASEACSGKSREWRDHVEAIARELTDGPSPSLYEEALEFIASYEGSAGGLNDWWRSKRRERATLNMEQQAALGKLYNDRFNHLISRQDGEAP
jgi:hypothetical protein